MVSIIYNIFPQRRITPLPFISNISQVDGLEGREVVEVRGIPPGGLSVNWVECLVCCILLCKGELSPVLTMDCVGIEFGDVGRKVLPTSSSIYSKLFGMIDIYYYLGITAVANHRFLHPSSIYGIQGGFLCVANSNHFFLFFT